MKLQDCKHPQITLGILGSYVPVDISYNVNTYIGQSFQDFELIFCFDRRQCVPVSDIIDTLNAHHFNINNRVKILENPDNTGLICNAMRINAEAKGNYIFFLSLEDAFYDTQALSRINSVLQDNSSCINLFRTLINHDNEWIVYPSPANPHNTVSICYPKNALSNWKKHQIEGQNNFALFQQELLNQLTESGHPLYYADENTIVHACSRGSISLHNYYSVIDSWTLQVSTALSKTESSVAEPSLRRLTYTYIRKLLQLLDTSDCSEKEITGEYYQVYRLTSQCVWKMPHSTEDYLRVLQYIYLQLTTPSAKGDNLSFLRHKLTFLKKIKKMKLLFLAHEYSVWPSLQSVYEEAIHNRHFEVQLVYVPFFHEFSQVDDVRELSFYRNAGYNIISGQDYNLSEECPDVVFYLKPYDSIPTQYQVKELRKIVETIVYIPYGMEIGDTEECLTYQCYGNMQYYATYIPAYSPFYMEKMRKYTYTKGNNYLKSGHPRIDLRKKKLSEANKYIRSVRKKAGKRKIVLWNTHFTLSEGDNWGSFLIYGQTILDYFRKHSDIFLLWRPHPLFYQALAKVRHETPDETSRWLGEISSAENIMLDRAASYLPSFHASDMMISDWASMVPEYVAYGKSVLVTPKSESSRSILSKADSGDVEEYFHIAHSAEDIIQFLDFVRSNRFKVRKNKKCSTLLFYPSHKTVAKDLLDILRRHWNQ